MSVAEIEARPEHGALGERPPVVNDFSIVVATANGSGSQTANAVLIRALFKMGIPVNGKNLFPSNISGLPTWYTIRVSKDGYVARREGTEILVAFNEKTVASDLASLPSGGVCIFSDDLKFERSRTDVVYYGVPTKELVKAANVDVKLRDYVANMVYVGALTELLQIDRAEIREALVRHFKGKTKPIDLNYGVVTAAADWVREHITKEDPFRVEPMHATDGQILSNKLAVLEDDKGFFPAYNIAVSMRTDVYNAHKSAYDTLFTGLNKLLTTEQMTELNAAVDVDGEPVDRVVDDFLKEKKIV